MRKKEIITIAGKPGSGKSTTANILAETLGYERYSAGSFLRDIAKRRGISIEEASVSAKHDPSIDAGIDDAQVQVGKNKNRIIIDGRLAFHFIPDSFKVYLDLDLQVAAQRIFDAHSTERHEGGETADSVAALYSSIKNRFESEQSRYETLYRIDPNDPHHFDLIIDTSVSLPHAVATKIIEAYTQWLRT